jgi:HD-GYP domain-containing protein (c-di-GMP phosphodiesterase class II)
MGQPFDHALWTCLVALRLGEQLGLSQTELAEVYYVSLLRFVGCTADAHESAAIVGGDEISFRRTIAPALGGSTFDIMSHAVTSLGRDQRGIQRARVVGRFLRDGRHLPEGIRAHCELALNLATRLGLPSDVQSSLGHTFERWSGSGHPAGLVGDAIAFSARIAFFARDLVVLHQTYPPREVIAIARRRRGSSYDPGLVDVYQKFGRTLVEGIGTGPAWQMAIEAEPLPRYEISESRINRVLEVFADFADLKSPFTLGHSRGVADLAARAARLLHWDDHRVSTLLRAGLVHDLGRVGVPSGIWDKAGPLSEGEWERVRLHPYYTERIVNRTRALASLAVARSHHERLDGSGYYRGLMAGQLSGEARVLAAADVYHAITEPRPHRPAHSNSEASRILAAEAEAGRLDREAVNAVLLAAGHRPAPARSAWPAGLSDREVEVLRRLCRGETKRQVAEALSISPSTADHHVRHIYGKIGVSTRAGAAVFAIENGLIQE